MFELNAIERSCSRTLAGIQRLVLIDPNDLVTQPRWNIMPTIADLEFKPGKGAYSFATALHSSRLEDDTDTNQAGGDVITYKLTAFVRSISTEFELLRAKLMNRRIHVVATYKDGAQRFLPYMRLSAKGDSGARGSSDKRGYSITGVCVLEKIAPFLNGTFDIIGGPPVAPEVPPSAGGVTVVPITTSDSSYTYTIPADKLLIAVYVTGTNAQEVSIGLTAGGVELGGPVPLMASAPDNKATFETVFRTAASTNIYISGLVGTNTIEIWLIG